MNIFEPHFTNENAAREKLESIRWPDGPFCPQCGSFQAVRLPAQRGRPSKAHPEGALREGILQCRSCRAQYSVTVGTVFESSKVPLYKWLLCNHLLVSSKKGISAHQIGRMLGVTYKTAWFMCHRIREAMRNTNDTPFGSGGGVVEVDETFIGKEPNHKEFTKPKTGFHHKMKVLALVDRDTGRSKAFVIDYVAADVIRPIVYQNITREARLMTDESPVYRRMQREFKGYGTVNHAAGEYVSRLNPAMHTNTIEGYFSIFKRGMKGVYQHCGKHHLHRYLAEFDFRYSNRAANGFDDTARAEEALKGIYGRRLTYRRPDQLAG